MEIGEGMVVKFYSLPIENLFITTHTNTHILSRDVGNAGEFEFLVRQLPPRQQGRMRLPSVF